MTAKKPSSNSSSSSSSSSRKNDLKWRLWRQPTSTIPLPSIRPRPSPPTASRSPSSLSSHGGARASIRPACSSPSASHPCAAVGEEWRLAATELSRRLIHATRKRDEALAEASHLKYSVAELEKKLAGLESYSRDLKSNLDHFNHYRPVAVAVGEG